MVDLKPTVREAATQALTKCCAAIGNRDIEPFVPHLIRCIGAPGEVPDCVHKLSATTFVQVRRGEEGLEQDARLPGWAAMQHWPHAQERPCPAHYCPLTLHASLSALTACSRWMAAPCPSWCPCWCAV